ncbi:DUF4476 domain-containing protein [Aureispira anguillae]|uniref:DUF4476 domain-containing protein n=1 Tax=Aureispira anguillae TaxID=2864201 RepID=A0A916DQP7_9BACT|nr:DUF4476 domain-containing protein [Aureispira anguillae]BDS09837.1 DUF4476 domain-containing protein [Aureispira anguillae]
MKTIYTLVTLFSVLVLGQAQHYHPHPIPMSEAEFGQALRHIQQESFDDGKMRIAKGVINGNYVLAGQVKTMIKEFSFKDSQEKLAMYAYPKTYDQKNYYMIYDVFTFSSSKDKVSQWVSTQPIIDYQSDPYYGPIPMTDAEFSQALQYVRNESFDNGKMRVAKQLIDGNYIYTRQVKVLIKEFSFKGGQEDIARYAYPKTYDQKNYYMVFDAFTFSSSKRELDEWLEGQPIHDYNRPSHLNHGGINHNSNLGQGGNGNGWNNSPNNGRPNGTPNNNNWNTNNPNNGRPNGMPNTNNSNNNNNNTWNNNRPNHNGTVGINPINNGNTTNDKVVLSDAEFANVKAQIAALATDREKLVRAKQISDQTYWSAHHVKELMRLFIFEDIRLDFAKYAYAKTVDQRNYYLVKETLTDSNKKRELNEYIQRMGGSQNNPTSGNPIQAMSIRDFATAKSKIEAFSSDKDRFEEAKVVISANFLTTEQIKEIMGLFIFEDVRLDFAKQAYQKTFDPQNYASIKAALVNRSSQQELQRYLDQY